MMVFSILKCFVANLGQEWRKTATKSGRWQSHRGVQFSRSGVGRFVVPVRSCDLAHGSREPGASPEEPRAKGPRGDDSHGDGGVVEGLVGDGVGGGQAEDDADEADPQHADGGYGLGHGAEPEGPAAEIGGEEKPDEDGDAIGNVQTDGGDGGCSREGDGGAERGESEAERERGGEPDGADRGFESRVDFGEEGGEAWGR